MVVRDAKKSGIKRHTVNQYPVYSPWCHEVAEHVLGSELVQTRVEWFRSTGDSVVRCGYLTWLANDPDLLAQLWAAEVRAKQVPANYIFKAHAS